MRAYWRLVRTITFKSAAQGAFATVVLFWCVYGIYHLLFEVLSFKFQAAVCFTVLFYMLAISALGMFMSSDLVNALADADKKLKETKTRAGAFHQVLLNAIAERLAASAIAGALATQCFFLASHAWLALNPEVLSRKATASELNYYILDLILKGALFDWMEHFKIRIVQLEARPGTAYNQFSFHFRLFVSLIAVGTFAKLMSLYKVVFALPEHRALLAKLARNIASREEV